MSPDPKSPSLTLRIAIGKLIGGAFGLLGFVSLPWFFPEATLSFRWGILLWYTTMGAIVGLIGTYSWHPILKLPMPWYFRAPWIGAWMNFTLSLLTWDTMEKIMVSMFGQSGPLTSPLWFTLEGAIIALIMGYFATRFAGEGRQTVESP